MPCPSRAGDGGKPFLPLRACIIRRLASPDSHPRTIPLKYKPANHLPSPQAVACKFDSGPSDRLEGAHGSSGRPSLVPLATGRGTFRTFASSKHHIRPPVNDDLVLIEQTLSGQSAAFGQLVTRYQDRLYNTLLRVVGSTEDARDLAQDAFVQAYRKLDTFRRGSGFYTWLYRIAFNLAASHQRRRRPQLSVDLAREATGQEPADDDPGPQANAEQHERAVQVQKALDSLSEEHRAILVLREVDGCDYDTIAQVLGLAPGTVRSRLHRARLQLRDQLKPLLEIDLT